MTIILIALAAIVPLGCNDEDGPGQFRYPLKVGNNWNYTRTFSTGPDLDSLDVVLIEPVRVVVDGIENLSGVGDSYRLDIQHLDDPSISGAAYYQNQDDGLWQVGGCAGGATISPKLAPAASLPEILIHLDVASAFGCDGPPTIYVEPDRSLPYPIRIGQQWHFRTVDAIDVTIEKKITGWSAVEVPAGSFNAYRVEWIYTGPVRVSVVDDIASVGLIRRQITVPFTVTGHGHPEEPIEHIAYDLMELDSLRLR